MFPGRDRVDSCTLKSLKISIHLGVCRLISAYSYWSKYFRCNLAPGASHLPAPLFNTATTRTPGTKAQRTVTT